jgi:hypothetical protein
MPEIIFKGDKHVLPAGIKKTCSNCGSVIVTDEEDHKECERYGTGWVISCPVCSSRLYLDKNSG